MKSQLHKLLEDFCVAMNSESRSLMVKVEEPNETAFPDYRAMKYEFSGYCYALSFYDTNHKFLGEINIIDCPQRLLGFSPCLRVREDEIYLTSYREIFVSDLVIVGYTRSYTHNLAYIVRACRWFENLYQTLLTLGRTVLIEVSGILELQTEKAINAVRQKDLGCIKRESKAVASFVNKLMMQKVPQVYEIHTGGSIYVGQC